ncbi:MAG: hypothetical protein ACRERE_36145 [Candidatus Entotheonellia bacterium]
MSWRTEWKGISTQIQGLVDSGKFYLEASGAESSAAHIFMKRSLILRARNIFKIIKKFSSDHNSTLPTSANECLEQFIMDYSHLFFPNGENSESQLDLAIEASKRYKGKNEAIRTLLAVLVLLQSELTSHLSDFSVIAKRLSERAFLHLQRSIIANKRIKQEWYNAFKDTIKAEIECEKLGGAHLLLHGIWAFKVHTSEERTDLVLQEPIRDFDEVGRAAEALVLTEWKIVRNASELEKKAKEAHDQARIYAASVLGGIELRQYRYLVLVSKDRLQRIKDIPEGDIVYRHINITVDPKPPSQAARTTKKRIK